MAFTCICQATRHRGRTLRPSRQHGRKNSFHQFISFCYFRVLSFQFHDTFPQFPAKKPTLASFPSQLCYNNRPIPSFMPMTAEMILVPLTKPSKNTPGAGGQPDVFLVDRLRKGKTAAGEAL